MKTLYFIKVNIIKLEGNVVKQNCNTHLRSDFNFT